MVNRDMARRLRPVLLIAVVAAIALIAPHGALSESESSHVDQHAAVAAAKPTSTRTVADRTPRPAQPLVPFAVLLGGLASVALLLARHDRLIGRRMRRLDDVGHDWRSLLIGAPPALA